MEHDAPIILFFVKEPQRGLVKSRLAMALGADNALKLYRTFVCDMLATVDSAGTPCAICFHPPDAGAALSGWLGTLRSYRPQRGTDVGDRMEQAFRSIFAEGYGRAVLIGSDIPDLPAWVLTDALRELSRNDAVIGPARDGGYYLIGFRRDSFLPDVFHGIAWSRPDVFDRTMRILRRNGTTVRLLPLWQDIDTVEDVLSLMRRNRTGTFADSRTMSCLRTIITDGIPGLEGHCGTL